MAYTPKNLSVIGYANGFTLWHYATPDSAASVDTTGYFNTAADMLRVGDFIFANCATGGAATHGIFVVASNAGGTVDLADLTPFGGSDTD
ncbi:hypothetical protein [Ferrovibrio sp.]|uniref:hypothetical protein n=1 Tax=Ferrovibrio sp. TaxID=1917215 RepID=UPI003D2A4004